MAAGFDGGGACGKKGRWTRSAGGSALWLGGPRAIVLASAALMFGGGQLVDHYRTRIP
jgi:hypothetical protein